MCAIQGLGSCSHSKRLSGSSTFRARLEPMLVHRSSILSCCRITNCVILWSISNSMHTKYFNALGFRPDLWILLLGRSNTWQEKFANKPTLISLVLSLRDLVSWSHIPLCAWTCAIHLFVTFKHKLNWQINCLLQTDGSRMTHWLSLCMPRGGRTWLNYGENDADDESAQNTLTDTTK